MNAHDAWLRALRASKKGPVNLSGGVRGQAWSEPIEIEGDWSGAALTGRLRLTPDAPTVLANITMTGPVVTGGVSTWMASLTSVQTSSLPGDADLSGVEYFPYSVDLTPSGGNTETLIAGLFPLRGIV